MDITHFPFEELDLVPVTEDGFDAGARIDGVAHVNYARSGVWTIVAVEIALSKVVAGVVFRRNEPAPLYLLPHLIRALSVERWRKSIQDHVDEVVASDISDAKAEAQAKAEANMRSMEP